MHRINMVDRGAESGGVHSQSMSVLSVIDPFLLSPHPCAPTSRLFEVLCITVSFP